MVRILATALCLVLAAVPASASFLQDTLEPYAGEAALMQHDGGIHGDAPSTCADVDPARTMSVGDEGKEGMLLEKDDEADAYAYIMDGAHVGERVSFQLDLGVLNERYDIAFDIQAPGCGATVLTGESVYYDPAPAEPYAEQEGQAVTWAEAQPQACAADWTFQADGMLGFDPASDIYVLWSDGSYAFVPFSDLVDTYTVVDEDDGDGKKGHGHDHDDDKHDGRHDDDEEPVLTAQAARYVSTLNTGVTVSRLAIRMPSSWTGSLTVASGPCDAVEGTPPEAPIAASTYAEFTVQETGMHVIIVSISRSTEDKTVDTVTGLASDPPSSVPLYCHDVCTRALQYTSYDMASSVK